MKICYLPGRESSYSRTRVFLKGMKDAGVEVLDCSYPHKNFLRYIVGFWRFLLNKGKSDVILVGFMGHIIMPFVKLFTRKPLIFDAFVSVYQTMVTDRQAFVPGGPRAKAARFLDTFACSLADAVLLDTDAHINYFVSNLGIDRKKFYKVPAGADDSVMYPRPKNNGNGHGLVHFHGEFQRLHGAGYIITAASVLPDVKFRMIGKGPALQETKDMAARLNISNVEFLGPVSYEKLAEYMAEADICLGIFGDTQKAGLVIPHKVYEALAMGKPVITADTPAARELLIDGNNALLCRVAHGEGIATHINSLIGDRMLRESIAKNGHDTFTGKCSPFHVGGMIAEIAGIISRRG